MRRAIRQMSSLLDAGARRRMVVALLGSLVVAGLEIIGLGLVLPLLELLTNSGSTGAGASSSVRMISDVLGSTDESELELVLAIAVVVAFASRTVLTVLLRWWTLGFTLQSEAKLAARLLDLYLRAPYRYHLRRNSAELVRTLETSAREAFSRSVGPSVNVATEGAVIAGITLVLLVLQPLIAIGTGLYFLVVVLVYQRIINRRAHALGYEYQRLAAETYKAIQQSLGGVKEVQVANRQPFFVDRLAGFKNEAAGVERRFQFYAELPRQYLETAFILGGGLLALVLAQTSDDDAFAILGLFVAAGFRLLPTLYRFVSSATTFKTGLAAVEIVCDDIAELEEAIAADRPRPVSRASIPTLERELHLEGVSFSYGDPSRLVLDDVSLTVRRGDSAAIVGTSGAGKSTLVDLILGLHHPLRGSIRVDGVDIASDLEGWQDQLGMVPQDVYLLDASLRENVAFGVPEQEIDEARVLEAIRRAQLESFVASLPHGLDTVTGERGVRISGGQRQRLGIARAFYTQPRVLVLDEATSALDNRTEAEFSATIDQLRGTLTMIVIAHRLSTVKNCDHVFLLEHGRLSASGSFEELVASSPAFAQLAELARLP
ncbi:MAG TPA: ABC transporter ATP-binding protein [Acidimicrobiia bacterium]